MRLAALMPGLCSSCYCRRHRTGGPALPWPRRFRFRQSPIRNHCPVLLCIMRFQKSYKAHAQALCNVRLLCPFFALCLVQNPMRMHSCLAVKMTWKNLVPFICSVIIVACQPCGSCCCRPHCTGGPASLWPRRSRCWTPCIENYCLFIQSVRRACCSTPCGCTSCVVLKMTRVVPNSN